MNIKETLEYQHRRIEELEEANKVLSRIALNLSEKKVNKNE